MISNVQTSMEATMEDRKLISYLAAPYSSEDPSIRNFRLTAVTMLAYELFKNGRLVYSPLTHNIPISYLGIEANYQTWLAFDHEMLSRCDNIIIFKLPGWEDSKGLQAEMKRAEIIKLPMEHILPDDNFLEKVKTSVARINSKNN